MEIVNLLDRGEQFKVCSQYIDIPQPMHIYHSEEELEQGESGEGQPPIIKIYSIDKYLHLLMELDILKAKAYQSFLALNVWIKTKDEFLPSHTDPGGVTYYKTDLNGNKIPIHSGWVRLYRTYQNDYKHMLYTSSGIWSANLTKWDVGCGVKQQFSAVTRTNLPKEQKYQHRLNKILNRKVPTQKEISAVHALLNPLAETFFNTDKTLAKVYGSSIRKADRDKLITSELFRKAIMKEISILFPDLTLAIQEKIPADKMADFLEQIVVKSIKEESSEEAMSRMKEVIDMAYTKKSFESGMGNPVPLIAETTSQQESRAIAARSEVEREVDIEEERERQNYPSSYVMDDDLPDDIEQILPVEEE